MRFIWMFASLVVLAAAGTPKELSSQLRYDNYSVYRLDISNKIQLALIKTLSDVTHKYDIWRQYDEHTGQMDILVNPAEVLRFQSFLNLYGISSKVLILNIQRLIDVESVPNTMAASTFGWTRYHKLPEIEAWLDGILATYPDVTEGFEVGKSFEGRTIRGLKISYRSGNPGVFIESNIHANEWITSATCTWFINELLSSADEQVRDMAESHDWYIVPVLNVDGFVYSHEHDRLWRKTRQPSNISSCIGVDPNRNFDSHWGENEGASTDPCSTRYAGPAPYSEPEIRAMSELISSLKDKVNVLLSFHSYSQLVLSPYGHTAEVFPPNYDDLIEVAKAYADAVAALPYGSIYIYGSSAGVLYNTSGGTKDWAYTELDIKISFTIEFRDQGRFGFVLPPAFIIPNSEETLAGIQALLHKCEELGYLKLKYEL